MAALTHISTIRRLLFGSAVLLAAVPALAAADAGADVAISTFNAWCFKAGQTETKARDNMQADTAPFKLSFWDDSLEPRPDAAPRGVERRCEVSFAGDHTATAIAALQTQMATPPKFGTTIALPDTHSAQNGTALIEGRELLRGRVAVVHVGTRDTAAGTVETFMTVDRLYDGLGLPEK
ncbi:hypothetical protein SAMN04488523_104202 [Sulfitobacter brevis]|uniref:Invasion protein IalB, involved in pathogenesis n=1 Tax=Sulfitobacter brevis TaxID=74348 RepID=A0A1I1X0A6_9RHOB|nr:hypothetical protein [Sulfitobacter brevis]SFE00769.1 hypothetical protein SAMN04488523_104202 [Sulfitobacter brevis]